LELKALVERAKHGDPSVLPRIRAILDGHEEAWHHMGMASRYVEALHLDVLAGDDALVRESIRRQADQLRRDLAGPHPAAAESLLVDLVVSNWLQVQCTELAQAGAPGGSILQARHRSQRAESAQRKFLAAMKALAVLRDAVPRGLAPLGSLVPFPGDDGERLPA
jgi:hypothetical protein